MPQGPSRSRAATSYRRSEEKRSMSTSGVAERNELEKALSVDQHGIEPIPEGDRDSTSWQQFWIWFGANITPTSWVVGAIGPELGLSLVQWIGLMLGGQ